MIVCVGTCTFPEISTETIFGATADCAGAGETVIAMEASARIRPAHRWSAPRARQRLEVIKIFPLRVRSLQRSWRQECNAPHVRRVSFSTRTAVREVAIVSYHCRA